MRIFLPLLLLVVSVRAAWGPFAGSPSPAQPEAPQAAHDPFLDDSLPLSDATPLPSPAAAALQDRAGATLPSETAVTRPLGGSPYVTHGIWDKLLPGLLGPVPLGTTPYEGYEYRLGGFVFRPGIFKWEGLVLVLGSAYILSVWLGRQGNKKIAQTWSASVMELLEEQFARIEPLRSESSESYYLWATGRRNVKGGARIHISLRPRGDVLLQIYEVVRGIIEPNWSGASADKVEIEIPLDTGGDYVFCVADKAAIRMLRERWDLSTFAPVGESNLIPGAYCTMTENNGVQEAILRSQDLGLPALLASGDPAAPLLESLIVSDVGEEQPSEATLLTDTPLPKNRQVLVSFRLRRDTDPNLLFALALNLVDLLGKGKPSLPDGSAAKVARRRGEIVAGLKKPLLDEKREERDAKLRDVKREAERARLAALTPKQLAEEERRAKKREQRKQQSKMVRRG